MKIPPIVKSIVNQIKAHDWEAFIVGGCVRDLILNQAPKDWDITTNARPEQLTALFPKSFYENDYGTVSVITDSPDPTLKTIEITPYRIESKYSDQRHPDEVHFAKTLNEDLSRRDFTVNAMAMNISDQELKVIDLFNGQDDLNNKIIRAVGDANERFQEDALRLMRAVRFAATLEPGEIWEIEETTKAALITHHQLLALISPERIRDELVKIIMSPNAAKGLELLRRLKLMPYIIPELEQGFNVGQNKHHIYQIYQHNLLSLHYAAQKNFSLEVRMAALLHDIAKPQTKRGLGFDSTFYNHEVIGAKVAKTILSRLHFSKKDIEKITKLIRYHLFYYNVDEVGEASVRRLLKNVGQENIEDLLKVRQSDRKGSGVPKAEPYKLRHLKYLFDKVAQDPIQPKMLKINGNEIMQLLNIPAGPKIGQIMAYLLALVLADPTKNTQEFLTQETQHLGQMPDQELATLAQHAKKDVEKVEVKRDNMTKQKYWVT